MMRPRPVDSTRSTGNRADDWITTLNEIADAAERASHRLPDTRDPIRSSLRMMRANAQSIARSIDAHRKLRGFG